MMVLNVLERMLRRTLQGEWEVSVPLYFLHTLFKKEMLTLEYE